MSDRTPRPATARVARKAQRKPRPANDRRRVRRTLTALALLCGISALVASETALAQDWRTITARRQVAGEQELRVDLEFGAGRLRIEPAATGELYHAKIRYDAENLTPIASYEDGKLRVGVEGGNRRRRRVRAGTELNLGLGTTLPLYLEMTIGAAEADLEFGGLRLRRAEISIGASESRLRFSEPNPHRLEKLELTVGAAAFSALGLGNANAERIAFDAGVGEIVLDFSGEWRGDSRVDISLGLGSLSLRLPPDLGIRLLRDTFMVSFDPRGLVRREDGYYSENWDRAERRLTIALKGALGSVDIRWLTNGEVFY